MAEFGFLQEQGFFSAVISADVGLQQDSQWAKWHWKFP